MCYISLVFSAEVNWVLLIISYWKKLNLYFTNSCKKRFANFWLSYGSSHKSGVSRVIIEAPHPKQEILQ